GDDVGPGGKVTRMDFGDRLRLGQHEQVVVALHGLWMVGEALAAEGRLVELVALDHRAHGAVDDQDALGGSRLQRSDALLSGHALRASLASVGPLLATGRKPSRWQMA